MTTSTRIRLWHDDVRPAPKGWTWAKTNDEAKTLLSTGNVVEASLDHDLGADPSEGLYAQGRAEETGLDLAKWIAKGNFPRLEFITIHSWNPWGAEAMWKVLKEAGYEAHMRSYTIGNESYYA